MNDMSDYVLLPSFKDINTEIHDTIYKTSVTEIYLCEVEVNF